MNFSDEELRTLCDALEHTMTATQADIDTGLFIGEPDDLKDAKAHIKRMDALQDRILDKLFPKETS